MQILTDRKKCCYIEACFYFSNKQSLLKIIHDNSGEFLCLCLCSVERSWLTAATEMDSRRPSVACLWRFCIKIIKNFKKEFTFMNSFIDSFYKAGKTKATRYMSPPEKCHLYTRTDNIQSLKRKISDIAPHVTDNPTSINQF